eukprot:gene4809-5995_t
MSLFRLNVCDSITGVCFYEKIWKWSGTSVAEGICKLVLTFHKLSNEVGDTGEVRSVLFEAPTHHSLSALSFVNSISGNTSGPITTPSTPNTSSLSTSTSSSSSTTSTNSTTNTSNTNTTTTGGSSSSTTTTPNIRHSYHSRTPSTTGSSSTAKRIKPVVTAPPIRLACEKDDGLKISVSVFYDQPNIEDEVKLFILNILQEFGSIYGNNLPELRPILNEMSEFPEKCKTKPEEILSKFKDFEKVVETVKIQSKI